MKSILKTAIAGAIVGVASLASLPVQALPFLNGTVAIGDTSGAITHVPGGLVITGATSVTFADPDADGDGDVSVNSGTGSFSSLVAGNEVNISTRIMNLTALGTKSFDLSELLNPTFNGVKFTATTFTESISANVAPNFAILLTGAGTWTDLNGVWAATAGSYTLSLTQTTDTSDPNAAVSFSGTLSAFNRPVTVPEPGILGLIGLGLAGLAFLRRRQGSQVD